LVYRGHPLGLLCVAFRPDGAAVASAHGTNRGPSPIQLWDVSTGKTVANFAGHSTYVRRLTFFPDASRLASLGDDGVLKLWDLASTEEVLTLVAHRRSGLGLAVSLDGHRIATAGGEGNVLVWDGTPP
jgi:WD40 repeat protein